MAEDNTNIRSCPCGRVSLTKQGILVHMNSCEEATQEDINKHSSVDTESCKELRRRITEANSIKDLSKEVGVDRHNAGHHIRGECSHEHDVPPAVREEGTHDWVQKD